jgi:hypothetical protein
MANERLFVLQVVMAIEEQWFAESFEIGKEPVFDRIERRFYIDELLFAAHDEEDAYRTAVGWLEGFSDANHDGDGDITRYFAIGIHQLEEVARVSEVAEKAHDPYGISLPGFYLGDVDSGGAPLVRQKEELEVFRLQRLRQGD